QGQQQQAGPLVWIAGPDEVPHCPVRLVVALDIGSRLSASGRQRHRLPICPDLWIGRKASRHAGLYGLVDLCLNRGRGHNRPNLFPTSAAFCATMVPHRWATRSTHGRGARPLAPPCTIAPYLAV